MHNLVIKRNRLGNQKREGNKVADQETQLVSIKTSNTVENKVNIEKIRDIRMALRRRYAPRTNYGKIFNFHNHTKFFHAYFRRGF